jgi:hypothetical protein
MAPLVKELSGPEWVARFPDSAGTAALANRFRAGCEEFIAAMRAAGATVQISSTRRPAERAYLMHYCWQVHKRTISPQSVPAKAGVNIEWVHRKADGSLDLQKSRRAATAMVRAYDIAFRPALKSRHVEGLAIDMSISWSGDLSVARSGGGKVAIATTPRDGLNLKLRRVGKTYGVTKHPTDPPHWSTDGK